MVEEREEKKEIQAEYYEWDVVRREYVYRERFTLESEEEAVRGLEEAVRDLEDDGWVCEPQGDGSYICTKFVFLRYKVGVKILG